MSIKKILSVLMAVVLLATCIVPSFAMAKTCDCGNNPILIISGFSEYDLVNKTTGKKAFVPETDAITTAVKDALPSLSKLLASKKTQADYDAFCDDFLPIVNTLFDGVACLPNGDVKHEDVGLVAQFTGPVSDYGIEAVTATEVFDKDIVNSACNAIGEDHVWVYGLDWRVDPLVIADDINTYVQNIKQTSGHDKVSISGISMGGVAMSAYLGKYGYDDISNITMISSAWTGLEMVGNLFTGNIQIDEDGLYRIINESMTDDTVSNILKTSGILEKLIPIVSDLFACERDRIYTECLIPNFGYNLGLWAFVPDSYFAKAKVFMNERMNEGTSAQVTEFWQRANDYHNNIQTQMKDIMNQAKADGVCVAVVSNYNAQIAPITPSADLSSDQVIETVHTSGYATVAKIGSTLGDDYARNTHVSADRVIDASTCYLPDNTWFIKDQKHVEFSESNEYDNGAFYAWLLTAKEQYDVNTDARYPQFMKYERDAKILSRLANMDGDPSGDNQISIVDAKQILKYVSEARTFTDAEMWGADVNYDGTVNIVDAKLILRYVANS